MNPPKKRSSKKVVLDYKKMVQDIDKLVNNDWGFDMDSRFATSGKVKFSNEEAIEMARVIGQIYSVSHCLSCSACNSKYLPK